MMSSECRQNAHNPRKTGATAHGAAGALPTREHRTGAQRRPAAGVTEPDEAMAAKAAEELAERLMESRHRPAWRSSASSRQMASVRPAGKTWVLTA